MQMNVLHSAYSAPSASAKPAATVVESGVQTQTQEKSPQRAAQVTADKPVERVVPEEKKAAPLIDGTGVSLRFQRNEQTKELVAYLIDHKTKKVLRTIPPEMLHKLTPGQLINLTA